MTETTAELEISKDLREHKQWPELTWTIGTRTVVKYWAADWKKKKKKYHIDCSFKLNKKPSFISSFYKTEGRKIHTWWENQKWERKGNRKKKQERSNRPQRDWQNSEGVVGLVRSKSKTERPHEDWGGKVSIPSRPGQSEISEDLNVF